MSASKWVACGVAVFLLLGAPATRGAEPHAPARSADAASRGAPAHRISVDIRGPIALVEVTRTLPSAGGLFSASEGLLDIALPERSTLIDLEIGAGSTRRRADRLEPARAKEQYQEVLRRYRLEPAPERAGGPDESATLRLRLLRGSDLPVPAISVRYRFSTLLEYAEGRYRLRFPPSPELSPVAAEVVVRASSGPEGPPLAALEIAGVETAVSGGRRSATATGKVSTRSGWQVTSAFKPPAPPRAPRAAAGAQPARPMLAGTAARANAGSKDASSAVAVGVYGVGAPPSPAPERVLLLIDRSRSVGLAGLASERDVARVLLEQLPPSTHFDALFFDRAVKRLFTMSRPATREALGALDDEMVPDRLANGTDLRTALREAGELVRRESSAFGPRLLLAIVTDGALPEAIDGAALDRALGALPGIEVQIAALTVRTPEDEAPTPSARRILRGLPRARGGVERELRANEIVDGVRGALAALSRGGDLFAVRVVSPDDAQGHPLAELIPAGDGVTALVPAGKKARRLTVEAITRGAPTRLPLGTVAVDADWLRAPEPADAPSTRLAVAPGLAMLAEAVPRAKETPPAVVRGHLERSVVRDTLSLAYLPRARACYQTRPGATPAMQNLTGRVRLAIELVRGEVVNATVESSTLALPSLEACLTEAAFALEVPRAYRNDTPVTAVLNLVFRPRTPERQATAAEAIGTELDLILEDFRRWEQTQAAP